MKQTNTALEVGLLGSVLLGRYRVVRELARGGMGVVYLARGEGAVGFVKPVVIKLILPEHASNQRFLGMFVREAQILSQLRHPSIVNVLEFGEQDGAYIMVLEYVRGHHLGQWSRYLHLNQRHVPTDITIQIVIDVLDALHHAHEQRHPDGTPMDIVHRDVSPSNILLDEDGRARLLDFGVARMQGGDLEYKTQVRGFVGKLPYIAPEILSDRDATPQSDLYACAVVLHETILGRNTFRCDTQAATLLRVMTHVPDWVASAREDIPDELDEVLRKALAKKPEERFATAHDFANALRKLQHESESDVRRKLAALLREDFSAGMAGMLGIESLADRDEAWRRLSLHPPQASASAHEATGTSLRRKKPVQSLAPEQETLASTSSGGNPLPSATANAALADRAPATTQATTSAAGAPLPVVAPVAQPMVVPAPVSPPSPAAPQSKLLLAGLIIVGMLAIVAIVVSLQGRAAPAPVAPHFRVVAQPNPPQPVEPVAPAIVPPPEPVAAAPTAAAPEPEREPAPEPADARTAKPARARRGPDAASLTRAFRAQQPKIEACFRAHAVSLQGHPRMQVEVSLDADGTLAHVALAPASLATTPLGACIEQVARATKFPAQGQPVAFDIPVTASQVASPQ